MNNADMPATPVTVKPNEQQKAFGSAENVQYKGLTKREELASRNLASILSSLPHWESLGYLCQDNSEYARQAIDAADALLAELEK